MKFYSSSKMGLLTLVWTANILFSCSSQDDKSMEEQKITMSLDGQAPEVETMKVQYEDFQEELLSNGKIVANNHADLRFITPGIIKSILVSEGQTVKSGQIIAELEDSEVRNLLKQNELDAKKALLDYEDQLLRLGYRLKDTANIDAEVKSIAKLRSGLSLAEITFFKIRQQLENMKLRSPINGKVANMKAKSFNSSAAFDYVCTVIDNNALTVEFKVLEQELYFVENSSTVHISPFSLPEKKYFGKIKSINPLVDNAGMITVKAVLPNDGLLLDGMGVNVKIVRPHAKKLIVPKESVLDRQNRKVVFTLKDDSIAQWNYVEIGGENSTHYVIKSGLLPGTDVIYKGNFNLAHDRKVKRSDK